ncbi:unnamed protein product [Adineta ricciae]|uniref:F-box domain-containing protein n=1 Tax=Adineta ricciae TaxID=249248 RepID=A0A815U5R1_ADIRI|nr:unnamed protein product [Adineta ricciae]CAF1509579.1 unnamed protein product [Adineta ricciae]
MAQVQSTTLFLRLPVEIFYEICDYLDLKTILLSFRYVCRDFHRITNDYNRYKIYLNTLSKHDIQRIYRMIQPKNINCLHIWFINKEIIQLFLSLFPINQFIRLKMLTLWNIEEFYLREILLHLATISSLRSFSIYSVKQSNISDEVSIHLSKLLLQSSLRSIRLMLNFKEDFSSFSLQRIHMNSCTDDQLISMINNCPSLRRLSLYSCPMISMDKNFNKSSLTHLEFYETKLSIDELESILRLTPLLTHLYMNNSKSRFNCFQRLSQWEDFIQINLIHLHTFQFSLTCEDYRINHIGLLLDAFRTSFWLKDKSWPITCELQCWFPWSQLTIYSSSNIQTFFPHCFDYKTIFCSTSTINNSWNVFLAANHNAFAYHTEWYRSILSPFLNKLSELALQIDDILSIQSLKYFLSRSNILNFVTSIWIIIDHPKFNDFKAIQDLLNISMYVNSVGICSKYGYMKDLIDKIFDRCDCHILNQLKIKTDDLSFMKWTIERVKDVESFKFLHYYSLPTIWTELIEWLTLKHDRKFSFEHDQYSLTITFHSHIEVANQL